MPDPQGLQRFVDAQAAVYGDVIAELGRGQKRSHWMWFIFPQIRGLGASHLARRFAIADLGEARAYLRHPILGPRLIECTQLAIDVRGRRIEEIFGYPDYLKFRSCMTLFDRADPGAAVFESALLAYFDGERDALTLQILDEPGSGA